VSGTAVGHHWRSRRTHPDVSLSVCGNEWERPTDPLHVGPAVSTLSVAVVVVQEVVVAEQPRTRVTGVALVQ
jgi:hypothetical protein